MKRIGMLLLAVGVTLSLEAKEYVQFAVRVIGGKDSKAQEFMIRIPKDKPELIAQAREKVKNPDHRQVVIGELAAGNASYNKGWSWHMIPETIDLVDMAAEVCDAEPRYIQDNLNAWIKSEKHPQAVGFYCPWAAEIIGEIGDKEMPAGQNVIKKPEQNRLILRRMKK